MVDVEKEPSTFINAVDKEMHDSIMRLYQKLKGVKTEIAVKLKSLAPGEDDTKEANLHSLDEEVDRALDSIEGLVNLVISEEYSLNEFQEKNRESIEALRQIFEENIEKITELRDKF